MSMAPAWPTCRGTRAADRDARSALAGGLQPPVRARDQTKVRLGAADDLVPAEGKLTCRVGGQTLAVRVAGRVGLSQGDATRLSWARGAQHFFDGKSGRRSQEETSHDSATMFA